MRWLIETRRFTVLMLALLVLGGGWIAASRDFNGRSAVAVSAAPQVGFTVKIPFRERNVNREGIDRIIMADKPAHTTYKLEFRSERDVDLDDVFYEMEKK